MSTTSRSSQNQVLATITNHSNVSNIRNVSNIPDKPSLIQKPSLRLNMKASSSSSLSPFEKIKLNTDRTTAHGHPLILPTEYGHFGPIFDVIALYHNAVKRQALVAYNTLEALQRFKYEVTPAEIELFFDWFHIFKDVIITILVVEDEHIFPFLDQNHVIIPISDVERTKARHVVSEKLAAITENLETIRLLAAGESVSRISEMVQAFLRVVLDYFELERVSLPNAIVAASISDEQEKQLHKNFIQALNGKDRAAIYLPFVSHWLSRHQLVAWKKANLSRFKALRYDQWKKRFSSSYQEIPVTILTRLTSRSSSGSRRSQRKSTPTSYFGRKNKYNLR